MAVDLLTLAAKLTLDKSNYDEGLSQAESSGSNFAKKLSSGLKTAGVVLSTGITAASAAVGKLTKMAVSGYAEYEQLVGGVETLFGESSSILMGYANRAYATAGMSANKYMETATGFAASLLQSLGGDTKAAADLADVAIQDMSDNANKMGTDITSIQNAYQGFAKQNYTMLDNLKLGYGGTKTEMLRLVEDAQKLDKTFKANTETVTKNKKKVEQLAPTFADVVKAINIVQQNMGITGTTSKEAAGTITGSLASVRAAWENLVVGMADEDQDFSQLISNFVDNAVVALKNLVPRIQKALEGVGRLVTSMVDVIGNELPGLVSSLLPPLLQAASQLFAAIASALPTLMQVIIDQLPTIITTILRSSSLFWL